MDKPEGWSPFLLLICIEVTLGAVLPIGYGFGVVNAPAQFIRQWCNESLHDRYDADLEGGALTALMAGFVATFTVGGIIGSLFGSLCAQKFGRKGTLIVAGIIYLIGGLALFLCRIVNTVEMMLAGRLICGIAAALVFTAQPMYLVELAPVEISGSVGVFTGIGVTGGIVVGQIFTFDFVLGSQKLWHLALAGFLIFVIIGYLPFVCFPESPHYYMYKGENEKAKKSLKRMRNDPDRVNAKLAFIESNSRSSDEKLKVSDVLCSAKYKLPLIVICSFHVVQQLSGINAIFYYSISIFTRAGFELEVATWLNFGTGVLNFIAALFGPILMVAFRRRLLMLLSCLCCSITLVCLSIGLSAMNYHSSIAFVCIVFLALFIISFNLGLGPMPYFIGSEIMEVAPRALAMSMGSLSNWVANFLVSMIFPHLVNLLGAFAFIPFAIACIYGLLITWFFLPETRGHNAAEIAPLMENGFRSKVK